jgi:predicted unusual protein kinase regulating ubiquinone biosynthesis (AarF/ABC1/UbiB family)
MDRARYRRIIYFAARQIWSIIWWDVILSHLGFRKRAARNRDARMQRLAHEFRLLAVRMGGVMIKVGQFLSSRVDVLPATITDELAGLQDEVPPVDFANIRRAAEAEYGCQLSEKFIFFDRQPLAAASLGQVHRARIEVKEAGETGDPQRPATRDVVVKIQRPNIETIIHTDLAALETVARWLNRYKPIRRRANIPALLQEFSRTLYEEIDYLAEGRNAETFAANFTDQPGIRVPSVVWTHSTRRALTLENVWGIKISDYEALTAAGIERSAVASRLLDTYLQQIFEDGFFHADPHPGNLFVNPNPVYTAEQMAALAAGTLKAPTSAPPATNGASPAGNSSTAPPWQLTFVDFGMVGHVPDNLRMGLREMIIGVGTRDSKRVTASYEMMGVLLPGADTSLLEKATATAFDRFWGRSMTELTNTDPRELRQFASEFREVLYEMPFQVPQDLIFLARAVGILSGIATGLDPDFNLFLHMQPYTQKLISQEARGGWEAWVGEAAGYLQTVINLPGRLDRLINRLERGEIATRNPELNRQVSRVERAVKQLTFGVIFAALLLASTLLYLGEKTWPAVAFLAGAAASLVFMFISSQRRN